MKLQFYPTKFLLTLIGTSISAIGFSQTSLIINSGSSWTVPAGVSQITVECWGAGGGGGYSSNTGAACGGGGGGAYAKKNAITVTPGDVISYSIGQGGSGGNGTFHGGDTWFFNSSTVLAKGGNGTANNSAAASLGGQASSSIGDVKHSGGNGGPGSSGDGSKDAGGGGGAAGALAPGMNGGPGDNSANTAGTNGIRQGGNAGLGYPFSSPTTGRGGNGTDNYGDGDNAEAYAAGGGGGKRCDSGILCNSKNGGSGSQGVIRITYCLAPILSGGISGNTSVCTNATQLYSAPNISGATYIWTLPSGWTGTSTTNTINVTAGATNGTVSVKVENSCGKSLNDLSLIVSAVGQAPAAGTITGLSNICLNNGAQIYSVAVNPLVTNYTWTLPAGWIGASTTNSITVTPSLSSGNVSVVANTATCGSSAPSDLMVSVLDIANAPAPISGNTLVCAGNNVSYSILNDPTVTNYIWDVPNDWTSNNSTTNVLNTQVGTMNGDISVQAVNTCGSSAFTQLPVKLGSVTSETINVHGCGSTVVNGVSYSTDGQYLQTLSNYAGCDSTLSIFVQLTNVVANYTKEGNIFSATENGLKYYWLACEDSLILDTTKSFTPALNGMYRLVVEKNGCTDTTSCFEYNKIGLETIEKGINYSVYPNPAADFINIKYDGKWEGSKVSISVLDVTGKVIMNQQLSEISDNYTISINTSSLSAGLYFIKLEGNNLQLPIKKVVIK